MGDWGKITNPKDLDMLVKVALTESNGTDAGIRDVASVIFNRASATNKSIAQIVTAKNQFEAVTNGRAARVSRTSKEYQNTLNALKPLLTGQIGDTTGGATLFVSPEGQSAMGRNMPKWAIPSRMTKEANGHQFYRGAFPDSGGDGNLNEVNQYVGGFIQRSQKQTAEIRNKINQTFSEAEKQAKAATTDNITLQLKKQYYDYRSGKMTPEQEAEYERNVNVGNIMLAPNQSLKRQVINAPPLPIEVINKYNSHEGDDGNYRQNVEYMVKSGEFSIPKGYELKIPPKRTAGETLAMQTGQIALGAAGAADIIANPVKEFANPIIQAVGGKPIAQNPTQTGTQQLLDMAGVAKPQTPVEQLAAGAGRGLGSVLPFMGTGAVIKGAGGAAGAIGEGLTSTPMADLAGGAASGLAAEGTRQAGGNEAAQFAAGLVGGIGGFGLAKAAENTLAKIGAKQGQSIAQIISEKPPTKPLVDGAGQLTDDGVEFGIEHGLKADEVKAALIPEMPTQKAPISEAMPEAQLSKQAETIPATAATRLSEAQSLDVPLTKGQATQSFDVQDAENTLRASQGVEGQQARNFDINQAQKIEQAKNNLLQSISDMNETPEIRGQKVKDQLRVLKDEGAAGVKAAYQVADEAAKRLGGDAIKLNTDNIKEIYKQISVDEFVEPQIKKSIQQEMARYGLVGKAEKINENGITKVIFDDGSSMNIYGNIKPLTLSNADNFAKQMNSLYLQDKSYASQAMKRAVNDSLYGALENGKFPELATAKQEFGKFKGNFEAKDIVQKLIDYRKGTNTDIILPERTIPSILGNGAGSVSNLKRIKSILLSSKSEESKAAWNAIQVQGLSDIFEGAYQVNTNLGAGATPTISGAKLNTNISKFGTDKLKILFDEKQFNEIMKLRRVISNATIPVKGTVNTSGTAYKIANMIATRVPIIGKYVDTAQTLLGHANEWLQAKKTLENMTNFNESKALQEPLAAQSSKVQELMNRADEAANAMLQELFKVSPTLVAPIINAPQKPQE